METDGDSGGRDGRVTPLTDALARAAGVSARPARYPFYAFRLWQGMPASVWLRILAENRFAVSPRRIPRALRLSFYSIFNAALRLAQELVFGKRIEAAGLPRAPLFIIGHWRTGTTLLHELLRVADGFTAPTILECSAPDHFLISGPALRFFTFLLPRRRPMDDVPINWNSTQEDEFALMNTGAKSPYETLLFPNHRPLRQEFLTLAGLPASDLEAWKAAFARFLRSVNFRSMAAAPGRAQRIVLKSPPHTARLRVLRTMFPAAQYIHIVRNPYDIFASTLLLWRALFLTQGMQILRPEKLSGAVPSLEDYVLQTMDVLYRDFFEQIELIPAQQFCQIRYEDLIGAPLAEMERLYRRLDLGDFSAVRPALESHLAGLAHYRGNRHSVSARYKDEIRRRWRWYFERFEYPLE